MAPTRKTHVQIPTVVFKHLERLQVPIRKDITGCRVCGCPRQLKASVSCFKKKGVAQSLDFLIFLLGQRAFFHLHMCSYRYGQGKLWHPGKKHPAGHKTWDHDRWKWCQPARQQPHSRHNLGFPLPIPQTTRPNPALLGRADKIAAGGGVATGQVTWVLIKETLWRSQVSSWPNQLCQRVLRERGQPAQHLSLPWELGSGWNASFWRIKPHFETLSLLL